MKGGTRVVFISKIQNWEGLVQIRGDHFEPAPRARLGNGRVLGTFFALWTRARLEFFEKYRLTSNLDSEKYAKFRPVHKMAQKARQAGPEIPGFVADFLAQLCPRFRLEMGYLFGPKPGSSHDHL